MKLNLARMTLFYVLLFVSNFATVAMAARDTALEAHLKQLCGYAETQGDRGNYSGAEVSITKVLNLAQRQGKNDPLVAEVLRTKVSILIGEKKVSDAETCANEAFSIDKEFKDSNVLTNDYLKLSDVYLAGLRLAPAYYAAKEAFELSDKSACKQSIDAGEALLDLYFVDAMCGQTKQAEQKLNKALEIARLPQNADTKFELSALKMLAFSLEQSEKFDQALPVEQQALAKSERIYGLDSISTEQCLKHLAQCYKQNGKYQDAYNVDKRRLPLVKRFYGSRSDELGELYSKLGDLETNYLYNGGNISNCPQAATETRNNNVEQKNSTHQSTPPYAAKALMFYRQGKPTPRMERDAILTTGHLTVDKRSELVFSRNKNVDPTQISKITKSIEKDEMRYGKSSPMLSASLSILGQLYMDNRDYDKAKECYKRAIEIYDGAIGSLTTPSEPCLFGSCLLANYQKMLAELQSEYEKVMATSKTDEINKALPTTTH